MNAKITRTIIGVVVKILFILLAIIILIIAGMIMYKANRYPEKIPDVFGIKPMIVLSSSMETSIYGGDLVFVKQVDINTLKENDVIAFRKENGKVITHRIIEVVNKGEKLLKTKGDANTAEDADLVEANNVEGVYIGRIPKLGNFLIFIQQPIGLAVVLLTILVFGLIWLSIINKIDEKKKMVEDEKYRKEFEEFKKMKKKQENKQTPKK